MSYLQPAEFVAKLVDSGESKIYMGRRDTVIRGFMAGAILALAVVFAVTITVKTGNSLLGAALFPVGFCMLYLMSFDLLTGVFMLTPLAWLDGRPGVSIGRILENWGLVFVGNLLGALTVALIMAINFTYGFTSPIDEVGQTIAHIGEGRTIGYKEHGFGGWLTLFLRGALCNWMVSMGVVGAMVSTSATGKIAAMWMPIMVFFYLGFEHSVVNMFLFPLGIAMGGGFTLGDYIFWNEIPTVLGNIVGGITLTGLTLYTTHVRTQPKRQIEAKTA